MKHLFLSILLLLITPELIAQKKEKIKGSKIVSIEKKQIESFDKIEVQDNLEIFLIKGEKNEVELEADDNLHDAIQISYSGNTIILNAAQEILSFKKFIIRVYFTESFQSVTARHKSKVHALERMELADLEFHAFDNAKLFLNTDATNLTINAEDKTEIQLNTKSENVTVILGKNTNMKALINSSKLKFDMYQKSKAAIEGDIIDLTLRLDNNSNFTGKNLTAKNLNLIAEGFSSGSVFAETTADLQMSGNCEIQLFGEPSITLSKFSDTASLLKKSIAVSK